MFPMTVTVRNVINVLRAQMNLTDCYNLLYNLLFYILVLIVDPSNTTICRVYSVQVLLSVINANLTLLLLLCNLQLY